MRFISLFAGIGGFDLGLERSGHECVGQVEIDSYCLKVLTKHWPNVPKHGDVRTFQGTEFGGYDLLVGGYPCQPFSNAGKRAGKDDERHLWPEVRRLIQATQPRFVLLENVSGHLSLGFGEVLEDLAESGYDAEWDCLPASSVGAPHQRDRLFIVAYPDGISRAERQPRRANQLLPRAGQGLRGREGEGQARHEPRGSGEDVAYPNDQRPQGSENGSVVKELGDARHEPTGSGATSSRQQPPMAAKGARLGGAWSPEPDVGRVADGIPSRVDRLRALGNAVVPQVAEWIGHRLKAIEDGY